MEKWTNDKRKHIAQSIVSLAERSDDHPDEFVLESFYDYDVIDRFINNKNQIVQGSRGMGKTHILKYLEKTLGNEVDKTIHCIFIDCSPVGSGGACGLNDNPEPLDYPFNKPTRFFESFLMRIYNKLHGFFKYQYFEDIRKKDKVFSLLSEMQNSIFTKSEIIDNSTITAVDGANTAESTHHSGSIAFFKDANIAKGHNKEKAKNASKERKENVRIRYSVTFSNFSFLLEELLEITNTRIVFLLDEWSFVPPNIQPYFAEFLRRTLLRIPRVKFKIAVIPQGNYYQSTINGQTIGFAIGDDIKFELDLDHTYSVDKAPSDIVSFCFGFLCKHISAMLKINIIESELVENMFENDRAAFMLVRASEGNPRDFILLAGKCARGFLSKEGFIITDKEVIFKARELFETSKLRNITKTARNLLTKLTKYVVYQHQNRGFLIDQDFLDSSRDLRTLINSRIIHILKENIIDYEQSLSGSCALLILNFGTYCEALYARKPINLFVGEDVLEKNIFGQREAKPYDSLLSYDDGNNERKYFVCYVNPYSGNNFDPHFFQNES